MPVGVPFCFFMANAIYVASYAVTNLILLRILTVIAGITTMPYFYLQAEPLWLAMFCQSMFVAINLYHLGRALLSGFPGLPGSDELPDPGVKAGSATYKA